MSPRKTTSPRAVSKSTSEPLSPVLEGSFTLDQARAAFELLNKRFELTPATFQATFDATWDQIRTAAARVGIAHVHDLITKQSKVLCDLTGLDVARELAQFHGAKRADDLHRYRNTIVAVAAATAASFRGDASTVYAHSVRSLKARTVFTHRPLTDDEIVLLRTAAAIAVVAVPANQPAGVYAQLDAGLTVKETTETTVDDVDDVEWPTIVIGLGNRNGLAGRILPLDHFASTVLSGSSIAATRTGKKSALLTYKPRTNLPGSFHAATSASGVINRFMQEVGLTHADVSPGSINRWRIQHTWLTDSPRAAEQISGRDAIATARLAKEEPLNDNEPTPFITAF